MNTSGLILDVYDDVGGTQIKEFFPSRESLPDFVKSAHALSSVERDSLPDDAFALVLLNDDHRLRKYACTDEGNTALSVVYFLKNAHKLPDVARQRAAENLKIACGWYDLEVPEELEKQALLKFIARKAAEKPLDTAMKAVTVPSLMKGTSQGMRQNLARVHAGEDMAGVQGGMAAMGGGIEHLASANLDHLQTMFGFKIAELTGSVTMPVSKDDKTCGPSSPTQTIKKTSSVGHLVPNHRGEQGESLELTTPVKGEAPKALPQHMSPVVEVTGLEAPKKETEKKASRFALPSYERYPLDNYGQVKQAAAYFEEYGRRFTPVDRREYCVNLVKRASELKIPISDTVKKYGSEKYASQAEFDVALQLRRQLLHRDDAVLLDKIASAAPSMAPDAFASVLEAFDQSCGLHRYYDNAVMDPYYSTFGFEKKAEERDDWSDVVGNYHITKQELETFALNQWHRLKHQFGAEFAEEFKKDPIGIYNSLPNAQKILIIRMATDNSPV